MDFIYEKDFIEIKEKHLSKLDKFTFDFIKILEKHAKYVIISGYVAILFGRNRSSEDVDIFIEKIDRKIFNKIWEEIYDEFECINTNDVKDAYDNYLSDGLALRFAKKNTFIPNIELKFPKVDLDVWTLYESKKVILNKKTLYIAPLELEIPYKLFLGSEKDIEDAMHLFDLFKDYLDIKTLTEFNRKLKTQDLFIKMNMPNIDLKELEKQKEENFKQRLEFIKKYVEWLKKTSNKEWSRQQNELID